MTTTTTTTTTIKSLRDEIDVLANEPVPAIQAWRAVASLVRGCGSIFSRQVIAWGRDHYADCNAQGGNENYQYSGVIGVVLGSQRSMVAKGGGQNGGRYYYDEDKDDCLFFSLDGRVYEVYKVEGSWSQWQGSSSHYTLYWREYKGEISDAELNEVLENVIAAMTSRRDSLRRRKVAGAGAANRILSALAAAAQKEGQ